MSQSIYAPFSMLLTYGSYGCLIHTGEDMVMQPEARFAVLQIMRFNEKEHAEQGAMPHE
jgi:hypothetical protein